MYQLPTDTVSTCQLVERVQGLPITAADINYNTVIISGDQESRL